MSHTVGLAVPLALAAALLHAAWNVLLKTSGNPLALSRRAVTSAMIVVTPIYTIAWVLAGRPALPRNGLALAFLSAAVELIYFVSLSEAYRRGKLSAVYPVARGTAPVLAIIIGLLLFGEQLSTFQIAGVVGLLAGIWLVRRPGNMGNALTPALLTGTAIAIYSAIDSQGVRTAPPWLYAWVLGWMTALMLLFWGRIAPHLAPLRHSPVSMEAQPIRLRTGIALGLLMLGSYFLVLIALSIAPLAVVAPLRESAVVLVAGWGVWRLGERGGAYLRLAGAVMIVAGIAAVSF